MEIPTIWKSGPRIPSKCHVFRPCCLHGPAAGSLPAIAVTMAGMRRCLFGRSSRACHRTPCKTRDDITEVTIQTDQADAVIDMLLGFGAFSASAVASTDTSATVTAHFKGPGKLDLTKMTSIIQNALDLTSPPLLTTRALAGAWSEYFPLSKSVEVRLPCHAGPSGGMMSETGRRVLRLEGSVAFGAGRQSSLLLLPLLIFIVRSFLVSA